jgi:hypothetical protein
MQCGCRCIICKYQQLESFSFVAPDGFDEMHHTCYLAVLVGHRQLYLSSMFENPLRN